MALEVSRTGPATIGPFYDHVGQVSPENETGFTMSSSGRKLVAGLTVSKTTLYALILFYFLPSQIIVVGS